MSSVDDQRRNKMRLSELDRFETVTIQCHDNPDPDALASAFGLYKYFFSK